MQERVIISLWTQPPWDDICIGDKQFMGDCLSDFSKFQRNYKTTFNTAVTRGVTMRFFNLKYNRKYLVGKYLAVGGVAQW